MLQRLPAKTTTLPYPEKKEVDTKWQPVEEYLQQKGLLHQVFEADLYLALDFALQDMVPCGHIVVLTENSQKRLCINPSLIPGMERYFAHYLAVDGEERANLHRNGTVSH
ncbi:MAG: hypothetical protein K6G15_04220 [Desulfovibrio sp.]|nr:hypothetical protein [Desulfovibrio sp.]